MYKSEVQGKGCIVARVVADSVSESGKRITTLELEYPRFILAELNTHRALSRNSASSRAIPIKKMIEQVRNNPAMPIHWGANQAGMQADGELDVSGRIATEDAWYCSANQAADRAEEMNGIGAHKQLVNRILEPYQIMKTVVTATEWNNFFYLRDHKDAQPEIAELARCMKAAMDNSEPELLKAGEWHTPYVEHIRDALGNLMYVPFDYEDMDCDHPYYNKTRVLPTMPPEDALKVSASCCAQVSYRLLDQSIDKALMIYDQLVNSKPVHASPFEHQAMPMLESEFDYNDPELIPEHGATHTDKDQGYWSGNFQGWIQHRQLIKDNVVSG